MIRQTQPFSALCALAIFTSVPYAAVFAQVPASLVPVGEREKMNYAAIGVQIYECKGGEKGPVWSFVAPEADLFDSNGRRVGKHYGGPAWEGDDGSKIVGSVVARADASRPGAIPHLLLAAKSEAKPGVFADVVSLQRVNTVGGVAPASGCDASKLGERARVYYTANYVYFVK